MKQWEEGGFLTQSHLSCLPLSRMSIRCTMRVLRVSGALPVNLMLLEKTKWGRRSEKKKRVERNGEEEEDRKKIGLLKERDCLKSFYFLAGFRNSMTLTYRENECFSLFLP